MSRVSTTTVLWSVVSLAVFAGGGAMLWFGGQLGAACYDKYEGVCQPPLGAQHWLSSCLPLGGIVVALSSMTFMPFLEGNRTPLHRAIGWTKEGNTAARMGVLAGVALLVALGVVFVAMFAPKL